MLKNPCCPTCRNNKRVIAHRITFMYICNKCNAQFFGRRTVDPDKQMVREEAAKEVEKAQLIADLEAKKESSTES